MRQPVIAMCDRVKDTQEDGGGGGGHLYSTMGV